MTEFLPGADPDSRKRDLKHRIAAAESVGDDKQAERLRGDLKAVDAEQASGSTKQKGDSDGQSRSDGRGAAARA